MDACTNETFVKLPAADAVGDLLKRLPVRLLLLARGSRRLFSSEEEMAKYLHSLQNAQPPFVLEKTGDIDNLLKHERIGAASCYTFTPRWISCRKHIIYFCGGAFLREATPQHIKFVDKLAATVRAEITMVCYPKAPTYTYADTYEIAARLYDRLAEEKGAENIILMGDSAGGSIALALCGFLKKVELPMPGGVIAISPICDLTLSSAAIEGYEKRDPFLGIPGLRLAVKKWCGAREANHPLLNPMDMDVSALPDLLLFCGTEELLNPDIRLFARHVNRLGGRADLRIYEGMFHDFPLLPFKAAEHAMNEIVSWLTK